MPRKPQCRSQIGCDRYGNIAPISLAMLWNTCKAIDAEIHHLTQDLHHPCPILHKDTISTVEDLREIDGNGSVSARVTFGVMECSIYAVEET